MKDAAGADVAYSVDTVAEVILKKWASMIKLEGEHTISLLCSLIIIIVLPLCSVST